MVGPAVIGGYGNEMVTGCSRRDSFAGGDGADDLSAGAGNDTLVGGAGADSLQGGSDTGTFSFNAIAGSGSAPPTVM